MSFYKLSRRGKRQANPRVERTLGRKVYIWSVRMGVGRGEKRVYIEPRRKGHGIMLATGRRKSSPSSAERPKNDLEEGGCARGRGSVVRFRGSDQSTPEKDH